MGPQHSIDFCPICGGGLCGVRICGLPKATEPHEEQDSESIHGLIICDECEAIWLEPDVTTDHLYPDPMDAICPVCCGSLWETSRWANSEDVAVLGWDAAVNHELDMNPGEGKV